MYRIEPRMSNLAPGVELICEPHAQAVETWIGEQEGYPSLALINGAAITHYHEHHTGQPADDWPRPEIPLRSAAPQDVQVFTPAHTPYTDGGLAMYDHLSPAEAVWQAWSDPGPYADWHAKCQRQVHALMPVLARALDRMEREHRG